MLVSPLIDAASEQVDWIKAARALRHPLRGLRRQLGQPDEQGPAPGRARSGHRVERGAEARGPRVSLHSGRTRSWRPGAQLFDQLVHEAGRRATGGVLRARRPARRRVRSCCSPAPPVSFPSRVPKWRSCCKWIAALRASDDPSLRDINVLVRPHPYNCHAWDPDPLVGPAWRGLLSAARLQSDRP